MALSGRLLAEGCSSISANDLPSLCIAGANQAAPCFLASQSTATQNCGHGTHVASIALGNFGAGAYYGMAPNTGFLAFQASSLELFAGLPRRTYLNTDVLASLSFALQNREQTGGRKLAAVNLSIGFLNAGSECGDTNPDTPFGQIRTAISDLRVNEISVVAAAGNGTGFDAAGTMSFPACAPGVISVAAVNRFNRQTGYTALTNKAGIFATLYAPGGDEFGGLPLNFQFLQEGIFADDDWSSTPSLLGASGNGFGNAPGVSPSDLLASDAPQPQIWANRQETNAAIFSGTGFAEFSQLSSVAVKPGANARAPYLLTNVSTSGFQTIKAQYYLAEIDNSSANAQQSFALQFRVGSTGSFTNVPSAFQADVTDGGSAGRETLVEAVLPAIANNKPLLQLRVMTTDAIGVDDWVSISGLEVTAVSGTATSAIADCSVANTQGVPSVCAARSTVNGTNIGAELRAGTSMAAPHVAGLIARMRDRFPSATRQQIEDLIVTTGIATPAVLNQSTTIMIPRIEPFLAFRQASRPNNQQAQSSVCRGMSWTAPQLLQATGYKVRTAFSQAGLGSAAAINVGNVLSFSFAQDGVAQVLAFDNQGDGAWSDAVEINAAACAPAAVTNMRTWQVNNCIIGAQWDALTGHTGDYEVKESCEDVGTMQTGIGIFRTLILTAQPQQSTQCNL